MKSLPPFIMTSEKGSFARHTIEERKPLIIDQILEDFDYTFSIRDELNQLKSELSGGLLKPLKEETSDREIWDLELQPWIGKTWLEIPWFLAEVFFYRRILEIVRYFSPGPFSNRDPYERMKEKELYDALQIFNQTNWSESKIDSYKGFRNACYRAMWGNRSDLSNLQEFDTDMGEQSENIIIDHSKAAYNLLAQRPSKIAYFMDNAGRELFFDLAFIDGLLQSQLAGSITLYLKNQPFFVSDVMPYDLNKTIQVLSASPSRTNQALSSRLVQALKTGKITIKAPIFLTTSCMYRGMPNASFKQLADYDLAIMKGDVNYRRLMDDRHWDPTTTVEEAAGYFPTNFLSLRTLKSEIILGLSHETYEHIRSTAEPDWLINGKRGMLTFHQKV